MSKILLVEDNPSIVKGLKYSLEQKNYKVVIAFNYVDALEMLNDTFDLAILDITLPDGSGYDICKKIKEEYEMPCLFLSAKDEEEDIVKGLELGAEDYITKPFGVRELLVRIEKILKREVKRKIVVVENTKVDLDKMQVFVDNNLVKLTKVEYKIISLLFTNLNRTITREKLIDVIWDIDGNFVNDNTLTVNIKRIREKLNSDVIKTVKGIGYMVESNEK
ncbi:MAG: response regulator transcription factor [Oscillospiraceae bacterium]|nr:response regulator transcription factor [Oscillospiraceae bacterium]